MGKVLLLSVLFAVMAIPARAALDKNPKRGFRKAMIFMVAYNVFYLFYLRFLYGRL